MDEDKLEQDEIARFTPAGRTFENESNKQLYLTKLTN